MLKYERLRRKEKIMPLPNDSIAANTLPEVTTIPTGKKLIFTDPDTNEGGIITLENLTKQILQNLTSQTFSLDQGTKTLVQALNELNSKALFGDSISIDKNTSIRYNQSMKLVVVERAENVTIDKNIESGPWVEIARVEEKYFPQHTTTFPIVLFPEGIAYGMITEEGLIKIYTNRKLISGKDQLYFQFLYFTA